jgi:hypothetical protein
MSLKELGLSYDCAPSWKNYIRALHNTYFPFTDQENQHIWSLNPTRVYVPRSGYIVLALENKVYPPLWWWKKRWKIKSKAKAKLFMSLLFHNKALTWDDYSEEICTACVDVVFVDKIRKQIITFYQL